MKLKNSMTALALALSLPAAGALFTTGCAGSRYERSTGEYIDDKALSSRVKSALGDNEEYRFGDVNVTTFRGTVQLSGFVNTTGQKRRAGEVAEAVEGVRNVENNITVKDDTR
jgi:hyperosmotically inducible periplasmic protein